MSSKRRRKIKNVCLSALVSDSIKRLELEIEINLAELQNETSDGSYSITLANIRNYQQTITTLKRFQSMGTNLCAPEYWPIEDALSFCINTQRYIDSIPEELTKIIDEEYESQLPKGYLIKQYLDKKGESEEVKEEFCNMFATKELEKKNICCVENEEIFLKNICQYYKDTHNPRFRVPKI